MLTNSTSTLVCVCAAVLINQPAGQWTEAVTFSITGGTHDFAHVIGGTITFAEEPYATAKFLYWKKEKSYY